MWRKTKLGWKTLSADLDNVSRFSQLTRTKPKLTASDPRKLMCGTAPMVLLLHSGPASLQVSHQRSRNDWSRWLPRGSQRVQRVVWLHLGFGPVGQSVPQKVEVEGLLEPPGQAAGGPAATPVGAQGFLGFQEQVQASLLLPRDLQEWVEKTHPPFTSCDVCDAPTALQQMKSVSIRGRQLPKRLEEKYSVVLFAARSVYLSIYCKSFWITPPTSSITSPTQKHTEQETQTNHLEDGVPQKVFHPVALKLYNSSV